ncbi:hypothetical protein [Mesoplasma lactucae]|uniref:Uncharacterized protein n=1 Tax=Mesoplasma lactucae ATCC 49193 TaxID=81460 RepID=A0A291IQK4_9MOLU|nr:hypothetical protein [Mesoplasma lactucae]ATG97205.1 hypothetical protein CP520_00295 [Mesoplasma lactucae ATCC 49193]ATZ20353.1 hypothetical protein MLACT_v1c05320 [Mesoplasma lactucae ATCC 49193]MCL8216524.1 hypothetical protein [Mesoplasma lactucae ATCC 49193]
MGNFENTMYLTKTRFKALKFKKRNFILYGVIMSLILLCAIGIGVIGVTSKYPDDLRTFTNIVVTIETIIIGVFCIVMNVWIFRMEKDTKIIKNEQHYGYNSRSIFLSRLIESLAWVVLILVSIIIINLIFAAGFGAFNNVSLYKSYLIALGWFAIMAIMATALTILFTTFASIIWSTLSTVLLVIVLAIFPAIGSINAIPSSQDDFDQYQNILRYQNTSKLYPALKSDKYTKIYDNWEGFIMYSSWEEKTFGWQEKWMNPNSEFDLSEIRNFYITFDSIFRNNESEFEKFKYTDIQNFYNKNAADKVNAEPIRKLLKQVSKMDTGNYKELISILEDVFSDDDLSWGMRYYDPYGDTGSYDNKITWESMAKDRKATPAMVMFYQVFVNAMNNVIEDISEISHATPEQLENIKKSSYISELANNTKKRAFYNPFTQFNLMFSGVDYKNELGSNTLASQDSAFSAVPIMKMNKLPTTDNPEDWKDIKGVRVVKTEGLYVGYLVLNGLIIFASYWIFKKQIQK